MQMMVHTPRRILPFVLLSACVIGLVNALNTVFRIGWWWDTFAVDFLFAFGLTLLIWWLNLKPLSRITQKLPGGPENTMHWPIRIGMSLMLTVLVVEISEKSGWFRRGWIGFKQPFIADEMKSLVITASVMLLFSLLETTDRYYRTRLENKRLLLENSVAQFETLKQQIHPHFLFNSLNILKTLISSHDEKAEQYLIRLSEFYRALLRFNNNRQVPLSDELAALENYLYLINIRFEGKFSCHIDIPQPVRNTYIPPLSLQMLLENCIKHNILRASSPLKVEIYVEDGKIVVRNNLLPKRSVGDAGGFGLENIRRRYELLTGAPIEISDNNGYFTVRLPLIS